MITFKPILVAFLGFTLFLQAPLSLRISGDLILKGEREISVPVSALGFAGTEPGTPPPTGSAGTATVYLAPNADTASLQRLAQTRTRFPEASLAARTASGTTRYEFADVTVSSFERGGADALVRVTLIYASVRSD